MWSDPPVWRGEATLEEEMLINREEKVARTEGAEWQQRLGQAETRRRGDVKSDKYLSLPPSFLDNYHYRKKYFSIKKNLVKYIETPLFVLWTVKCISGIKKIIKHLDIMKLWRTQIYYIYIWIYMWYQSFAKSYQIPIIFF